MESPKGKDGTASAAAVQFATVALLALALLQGAVFATGGPLRHRVIGLLIASGSVLLSLAPTLRRRPRPTPDPSVRLSQRVCDWLWDLFGVTPMRRPSPPPRIEGLPLFVALDEGSIEGLPPFVAPDEGGAERPSKFGFFVEQDSPEVRRSRRLPMLALFGGIGFANLIAHAALAPLPFRLRVLQTAVLFGYSAMCMAGAAWVLLGRAALGLLVSAVTGALVLAAVEALLEAGTRRPASNNAVTWVGGTVPHPVMEDFYAPNTEATTIYSANPRGYFKAVDARTQRWELGISHPGSAARLIVPDDPKFDGVRVEVDRAEVPTPWHIQLIYKGLTLQKDKAYVLAFNARADPPRTVSYIQAQRRPLWQTLGPFRERAVGTDWREYLDGFGATGTSDDAEVSFNLGASTGAFEVKGIEVREFATDASTVREPRAEYAVSYRFNDQGCRGPNRAIPARPDRRRILVLGNSSALGVGVYEADTFAAQLEGLLNGSAERAAAAPVNEVINCGVTGHGTLQQRQLFEILAPKYRPDIVIVAMTADDDRSWRSLAQQGYVHQVSRLERFFLTWGLVQYALHEGRRPKGDFTGSLRELRILADLCAGMNTKLVVVAFRNAPLSGPWQSLVQTISTGLAGASVPWLDLGENAGSKHQWTDLEVWPNVDRHPNEIFHRSAAEQVAALLRPGGL